MRTFLGMILGCLLTIGIVYLHDVRASSAVATSTTGIETKQIVNWDVARANWDQVTSNVREAFVKLKDSINIKA